MEFRNKTKLTSNHNDLTVSLTRKRDLLVNKLKKCDDFVKLFSIKEFSVSELVQRQAHLVNIYEEHDLRVGELAEILPVVEFEKLQEQVDIFEDNYHMLSRKFQTAIDQHSTHAQSKPQTTSNSEDSEAKKLGIKLPEFHIKKFDGDKLKWLAFKNVYFALIHTRTDISDIVKFTFLLDSITGKASEIIGAINLTSEGYQAAWNNLMRVYDKPKAIAQANIIGIVNLPKSKQGSPEELRNMLNLLTSHIASLHALDIKTDKMSELFIINIIINCLSSSLETEWNKTISIDDMPRLDDLILFLEKECSNLETRINIPHPTIIKNRQQSHNKDVRSFASTTYGKKTLYPYSCNVCKQTGHYTNQCNELLKSSVRDRIKKISHLSNNCLSPTHKIDTCKL